MREFLKPVQNLSETIKGLIFDGETPKDTESLLAPGKIEELVRKGRSPVKTGDIGTTNNSSQDEIEMQPCYQVPPKSFYSVDMKASASAGIYIFVDRLGAKLGSSTYILTEEQALEVEGRIDAEKRKLGKTS